MPLGKKRARKDSEKDKSDSKKETKAAKDKKTGKAAKEKKKEVKETKETTESKEKDTPKLPSKHVRYKLAKRKQIAKLEQQLSDQFNSGKLFACVSSRPGQCGRCDGYILEGRELEFYAKKVKKG